MRRCVLADLAADLGTHFGAVAPMHPAPYTCVTFVGMNLVDAGVVTNRAAIPFEPQRELIGAKPYRVEPQDARASVLAVHPDDAGALWFLGFTLIAKGRPEEAIPVLEKALSVSDRSPAVIGVLIRAYAFTGRRADALRLLAELKRRKRAGYIPAAAFVNAYLGLSEYDEAFAWLEQAYKEQSNMLQFLKVQPFYDPLRDDPRFKDLVRRVGLN